MRRYAALSLLIAFASCADKTPAPRTPATVVAPAPAPLMPAGPPIELLSADKARPFLVGTVSVSSIDRLFTNGAKLVGQAVPLPMDPAGLRDMLLSQAGLSPAVTSNMDFTSPCGAAIVALDQKGKVGTVVAVPARGPAEAQKIIEAMGKKVMSRGPVTLVESGTQGRGWLYQAGKVVVLSDDLEALARGAMLAIESQRASAEDIVATLIPEALARAHGTDVKSAIAGALKEARTAQAAAKGEQPIDDQAFEVITEIANLIADAERLELGVAADPAKGLILRGRFLARPGTKLETVARDVRPFEAEPAVLAGPGPRFMVGASVVGPVIRGILTGYRDRLAADKKKGAAAALAFYDAYLETTSGQYSGAGWLFKDEPGISATFSSAIKDAAGAARISAALQKLDASALEAIMRAQIGKTELFTWNVKKVTVGKMKAVQARVKLKKTAGVESEGLKRLFGSAFDVYWAVSGLRMVATLGRDARTRLIAFDKGAAPETTGPLAEAQAAAKGRGSFYYLDVAPMLSLIGSLSNEPRMAMLARGGSGPIPLVMTVGGDGVGKVWVADLTIPPIAFSSVGSLVVGAMGGGAMH